MDKLLRNGSVLCSKGHIFNEWSDCLIPPSSNYIDVETRCVKVCLIQLSKWLMDRSHQTVTSQLLIIAACQEKKKTSWAFTRRQKWRKQNKTLPLTSGDDEKTNFLWGNPEQSQHKTFPKTTVFKNVFVKQSKEIRCNLFSRALEICIFELCCWHRQLNSAEPVLTPAFNTRGWDLCWSSHLGKKAYEAYFFSKMLYYSFKILHTVCNQIMWWLWWLLASIYWNNTFHCVGHLSLFPLGPSLSHSHLIFSAAIQVSSNYWGPIGIGFSIFDAALVEITRCSASFLQPQPPRSAPY